MKSTPFIMNFSARLSEVYLLLLGGENHNHMRLRISDHFLVSGFTNQPFFLSSSFIINLPNVFNSTPHTLLFNFSP